jgi:hypothetical protein
MLLLSLVLRKDMGIDSCGIVGGGSGSGLNVNNNNNANENNGVGGVRKFYDLFPHWRVSCGKLSEERT